VEKPDDVISQIRKLVENKQTFADMAAIVNLEEYNTQIFDFYKYPLGVSFIGVKKSQVKDVVDAFVVLFIVDLYYQHDWIDSEKMRINEDQFVTEKPSTAEWSSILHDLWLKESFESKYRTFNIKEEDVKVFEKGYLWWMPETAPEEEQRRLEQEVATTVWVTSLFPGAFYDKFFGETEQYYFYAESGVYD